MTQSSLWQQLNFLLEGNDEAGFWPRFHGPGPVLLHPSSSSCCLTEMNSKPRPHPLLCNFNIHIHPTSLFCLTGVNSTFRRALYSQTSALCGWLLQRGCREIKQGLSLIKAFHSFDKLTDAWPHPLTHTEITYFLIFCPSCHESEQQCCLAFKRSEDKQRQD